MILLKQINSVISLSPLVDVANQLVIHEGFLQCKVVCALCRDVRLKRVTEQNPPIQIHAMRNVQWSF